MVAYSARAAATDRTTQRETHQRRGMVIVDLTAIAIAIGITLLLQVGASAPLRLDTPRLIVLSAVLLLWPLMLWEMQSRATTVVAGESHALPGTYGDSAQGGQRVSGQRISANTCRPPGPVVR